MGGILLIRNLICSRRQSHKSRDATLKSWPESIMIFLRDDKRVTTSIIVTFQESQVFPWIPKVEQLIMYITDLIEKESS